MPYNMYFYLNPGLYDDLIPVAKVDFLMMTCFHDACLQRQHFGRIALKYVAESSNLSFLTGFTVLK